MEEEKFSIDIPDTWNSTHRPGSLFSAEDADNTSGITVALFPNRTDGGMQATYINQIKNSLQKQADKFGGTSTIVQEGPLTVGGAPAYLIESSTNLPQNQTVFIHHYSVFANQKVYVVALQTYDVHLNPNMDEVIKSFRFLSPPQLPTVSSNSSSQVVAIKGEDFSITLPPGWTTTDIEGTLLQARDEANASTFMVRSFPAGNSPEALIKALKKSGPEQARSLGAKMEFNEEGATTLGGVSAYVLRGKAIMSPTETDYTCEYAFAANGKLYGISITTPYPDKLVEVEKIAKSLQFSHPPKVPKSYAVDSDYALGFRIGQITFYVLFAAAVVRGIFLVQKRMKR